MPGLRLLLGARHRSRVGPLAEQFGPAISGGAEPVAVDALDEDSLQRFCRRCSVVLNCAGPGSLIGGRVAQAALAAGCDYVDAGGDELLGRLADAVRASRRAAVVSAGMMPGLSALLPRALADRLDRVTALRSFVGGVDRFTAGAAGDYAASILDGFGESLAAWCDGAKVSRRLDPAHGVDLPGFDGPVTIYPFLSAEATALASQLELDQLLAYNVFGDERVLSVLTRLHASVVTAPDRATPDLDAAAGDLVRAGTVETLGRRRYQSLLFEMEGLRDGTAGVASLLLQASDSYELSGTMAALTVGAVARYRDAFLGLHRAGLVLDPAVILPELDRSPSVMALELVDGPLGDLQPEEAGVL
jgi:hypothetical protein